MTFTQIPDVLLVPGQYQEIDNSLAGASSEVKRALIIATMKASGTAQALVPVQIRSAAKAKLQFGNGSPAAIMTEKFLAKNTIEELTVLPVAEPSAGTKWSKVFTVSALNNKAGTIGFDICGQTGESGAAESEAPAAIAAGIVAGINSIDNCPVDAEIDGEDPTKFKVISGIKGITENDISVIITSNASGVTITPSAAVAATGTVDLTSAIAAMGETKFQYIMSEFSDADNIALLSAELTSRYSATRQIDGRCFIALTGEVGDASTEGTMLKKAQDANSPHIILVPRGISTQLPCVWAAVWCAMLCRRLADDPAANTSDIELAGLTGVELPFDDRQALLQAGVCTYRLDSTGTVLVERVPTSYTLNSDGERDTSYLDIQVVETVSAVRSYINSAARKRFKTWKLASTNENFGPGAKVMTASIWKSFLAELYLGTFIKEKQWCQDFDSYKASLIVSIKAGSKTRLEYQHQPVLIGQFYIGAGLNQFK